MAKKKKRYAVFVTTIALTEGLDPAHGICVAGMTKEQAQQEAQRAFEELNASDGCSLPWLVDEDQMTIIEAALPEEK